jgi:uncharacterized damage-inducible protein DinB
MGDLTGERADLVETLRKHRFFLVNTARELTDEQAAMKPTVSALSVGGLIKHVTRVERSWLAFAQGGAEAMEAIPVDWAGQFVMGPDESLAHLVKEYDRVAGETDDFVAVADLDVAHELPTAPWFEPGKSWSVRRVMMHLIAETSQHAGHADIIRETLDGAKSMG